MSPGPLVAVFAHPDDESLAAGGLIARHTARGGRAVVVTATWADDSHRATELAAAAAALGAESPRLLGYADARVRDSAPRAARLVEVPVAEAAALLAQHLRELAPSVVVTHDAHGGLTGHEDHEHTHRIAVEAARAAGVPRLLLATHPRSVVPALLELIGTRRAVHAVADVDIDEVLDVRPWLATKVRAVLAHDSQVRRGALPGIVAGLSRAQRETLLGTEWYAEVWHP